MDHVDRLLERITRCSNPESARALVELRADPVAQARIAELAEKCNQGEITPEERQEETEKQEVVRQRHDP